jgi:signal peptidase II
MKKLKPIHLVLLIAAIVVADQAIKIWIKTHYPQGLITKVGGMDWFQIYFIENPGMAWGWKFGDETGKLVLTLFRLVAVIVGTWYLKTMTKKNYSSGLMICAGLIYAGALGNLIDSLFYGLIFGYAPLFYGHVVDMLYFPIVQTTWPTWVPFVGGSKFEFFSPIFNIADASISIGVLVLFFFQKRLLPQENESTTAATVSTSQKHNDSKEIL